MCKVICIVQARMGSERLQGKVIKPIMGKPMVIYTLDRLKKSKYIDELILATSDFERENPLVAACEKFGYKVFRGSEEDVLKRYKTAVDMYGTDETAAIIRVTGDCPLIDPVIVDNVITKFLYNDYDYVRLDVPDTFVRGFDVEIFSRAALNKAFNCVHNKKEENEENNMYKEHVTLYMYRHPEAFKIGYVKGSDFYKKDYRLCVDTEEDFKLVSKIYNHFKDEFVSAKKVINYLKQNKEIAALNSDIKQKEV